MSNFVSKIVSIIKGDDAEAIAKKIQKKAQAGIKAQIAVKEAHTLVVEEKVEAAQEDADMALVNYGNSITNNDSYIENLLRTNQAVESAKKALERHNSELEFLKAKLAEISDVTPAA